MPTRPPASLRTSSSTQSTVVDPSIHGIDSVRPIVSRISLDISLYSRCTPQKFESRIDVNGNNYNNLKTIYTYICVYVCVYA